MRAPGTIAAALALACVCAFAAPVRVPLEVVVNGLARPGIVGWMEDGELWLSVEDAKALGLKKVAALRRVAGRDAVPLHALGPEVSFDEAETRLTVVLNPAELESGTALDFTRQRTANTAVSVADGLLLDYELGASASGGNRAFDATTRINSSFAGWQFIDERSATFSNGGTHSFPLRTTIRRDWPERALRLDFGTLDLPDPGLANWSVLRGVSFGTLLPGSAAANARLAATSLTAAVKFPSTAEVYVNGVRQGSFAVNPGTFDLQGLRGFAPGPTDVRVVLRDIFGNETVVQQNRYVGNNTVRAGAHEFTYQAGVDPHDEGKGLQLRISHLLGVSDSLTLVGRAEARKGFAEAQAGFALDLARFGEVGAGVMFGHATNERSPRGYYVTHVYSSRYWSSSTALLSRPELAFDLNGALRQRDMTQLATRQVWATGGGTQFMLDLSATRYGDHATANLWDVGFARRVGETVFMQATVGRSTLLGANAQLMVTWTPRPGYLGTSFTSSDRNGTLQQFSYAKLRTPGGSAWRVDAREQNGQESVTGYAEKDTGPGIVKANAQASATDTAWRLAWHSGLMAGYGTYTVRGNVADAAVVVDAQGLGGVGVYRNGMRVGETDPRGYYWVTDLPGYEELRVSLDENGIPMNRWYSGSDVRAVRPGPGSVVGVKFDIRDVRGADVRVSVGGAELRDQRLYFSSEGGAEVSALLKNGTAHVTGLLTGKQKVTTADGTCSGEVDVPKAGPVAVEMQCSR
jgi:outer membrane usher protein